MGAAESGIYVDCFRADAVATVVLYGEVPKGLFRNRTRAW